VADRLDQVDRDVARSRERITFAPVVIIAFVSINSADQHERLMAIQSVAASIQNLLLAAQDVGLGACWMAAPLYCPDVIRDVLQLPDDWDAQALITIGYPADEGKRRGRVDFRELTTYR
jgi:nitroreductase